MNLEFILTSIRFDLFYASRSVSVSLPAPVPVCSVSFPYGADGVDAAAINALTLIILMIALHGTDREVPGLRPHHPRKRILKDSEVIRGQLL